MANPLSRVFSNLAGNRRAVESIVPRRTFDDVVLPPSTRRALDQALAQVTSHDLIFNRWGLGERHPTGLALAFNFAGPSGTGKTICAEAIAHALNRRLLLVRYADVESMWMGETPKNVSALFRLAREENAVLLFDEADAIASRRSSSVEHGMQRESNTVVNVLLQELETFNGVVIFTTNLAANFDPAFERRIRTHVLFDMPGVEERESIWRVQLHPTLTPLADDVDFRALAEGYAVSGGDIRNAVLKAALAAASEPASDAFKVIHHRHLEEGIRDVVAGRQVMRQSLFDRGGGAGAAVDLGAGTDAISALNGGRAALPADPMELMLARLTALQRIALIAAVAGGASLIVAIVALIVALLR